MGTLTAMIEKDWSWLTGHLVLVLILILTVGGSVYGVESLIARHDSENASKYAAIAAQANQQNQQFQLQVQAEIKTLIEANQQLANQNAQLATALAKRQTVEVNIPRQVGSLTATQVATQLGGTATSDTINLPLPQAQTALSDVLLVPQLQADKTDLQTQLTNETQVAANNKKLYEDESTALTNEQKAHTADNTANAAKITALNAECKKSKWKWFGIGVAVGYGLRIITVK
jgi:hypothetical protein